MPDVSGPLLERALKILQENDPAAASEFATAIAKRATFEARYPSGDEQSESTPLAQALATPAGGIIDREILLSLTARDIHALKMKNPGLFERTMAALEAEASGLSVSHEPAAVA